MKLKRIFGPLAVAAVLSLPTVLSADGVRHWDSATGVGELEYDPPARNPLKPLMDIDPKTAGLALIVVSALFGLRRVAGGGMDPPRPG